MDEVRASVLVGLRFPALVQVRGGLVCGAVCGGRSVFAGDPGLALWAVGVDLVVWTGRSFGMTGFAGYLPVAKVLIAMLLRLPRTRRPFRLSDLSRTPAAQIHDREGFSSHSMKILRERKILRDHGAGQQARDGIRPHAAITAPHIH